MKKKILVPLVVVLLIVVSIVVIYFIPKTFGKGINPSDVDHIEVFDGSTGIGFTVSNPDEIEFIVTNIQSQSMKKDGISLGRMGYLFAIEYVDENDKSIVPRFIINSESIIRKDPFFYSCEGGLCVDYLKAIEEANINAQPGGVVVGGDTCPVICIDEVFYYDTNVKMATEPDESTVEYVEIPVGDRATVKAWSRIDDETLAVLINDEWYIFATK